MTARPRDLEAEKTRSVVYDRLFGGVSAPVRVGRFVLMDRIGAGAMGIVYSGYDSELSRKVAIKLLRNDKDSERLVREAKALARLNHPNVVTIYEAGTWDDQVFFAMEFVAGLDLRKWLREQPRSWRETLDVLIGAGTGLAAAHAAGLVHRDFKPENVLVTPEDLAKVGDFGLARPIDDTAASELAQRLPTEEIEPLQSLTRTGALLGTPAYIAPELAEGRVADACSDQFSFCVAAYEALWGERPFSGASIFALLEQARLGKIRPASGPSRVPKWLRRVIMRGLHCDPDRRHPSMNALIAELRRGAARRRRGTLAVGAAALVGAGAAWLGSAASAVDTRCTGSALVWQETWNEERAAAVKSAFLATRAARAEEQLADVVGQIDAYGERWIEIHRDACEATQLRGERSQGLLDLQVACLDRGRRGIETFVDLLTRADDTMVDRSSDAARKFHVEGCADLDDLQRAVRPPEDAETQQVVEEISMRLQEGRLLVELGHPEDARPILDAVVTDSDAVGYRPLQANARLAQLDTDTLAAQSKEGIERMYEALWFAEASGDDETTAESWLGLAGILAHHGRVDEALGAGQRADAVLERMGNPPELRARWHDSLGSIQLEQRHYADAVEHFTAAITIEEERLGDESQALSRYYGNLGNAHALHSAIEPAYRAFERAHELAVRHYGEDHPKIGYSLLNLGRMAARRDDFASSNEIYRKAIVILRAANGADDTLAAMTLNNLGQNYGDMGHYEEAIAAIEEAIPILERKMGREHRALLRPHRGLAEVYLDAGMFDHALAEGRAALEISLGSQGAAHPETGYCRRRLFEIHLARREYQQADVELDQAQKIFEQAGEEIGEVAVTRFFRAQLLWATKHRRQALVLAEQAAGELQAQGADFANKLEDVRTWLQSREG